MGGGGGSKQLQLACPPHHLRYVSIAHLCHSNLSSPGLTAFASFWICAEPGLCP